MRAHLDVHFDPVGLAVVGLGLGHRSGFVVGRVRLRRVQDLALGLCLPIIGWLRLVLTVRDRARLHRAIRHGRRIGDLEVDADRLHLLEQLLLRSDGAIERAHSVLCHVPLEERGRRANREHRRLLHSHAGVRLARDHGYVLVERELSTELLLRESPGQVLLVRLHDQRERSVLRPQILNLRQHRSCRVHPLRARLADEHHHVRAVDQMRAAAPEHSLSWHGDQLAADPVPPDQPPLEAQPVEVESSPLVRLGGGIELPPAHRGEEPAQSLEVRRLPGSAGPVVDDSDDDALGISIVHSHRITSSSLL